MKIDLDQVERVAKDARDAAGGPDIGGDWIVDKMTSDEAPDAGPFEGYFIVAPGREPIVADGTMAREIADHIAQCSPDVVLALVARVRELEKRCHIVESHPPDFMLEGEPLETQVFILKERLLDERHKSYRLECEVKELEEAIEDASADRRFEDR